VCLSAREAGEGESVVDVVCPASRVGAGRCDGVRGAIAAKIAAGGRLLSRIFLPRARGRFSERLETNVHVEEGRHSQYICYRTSDACCVVTDKSAFSDIFRHIYMCAKCLNETCFIWRSKCVFSQPAD
jgi:hypothetical protein